MRRCRFISPTRALTGLLTGLLFAILTIPLSAQAAPQSRAGKGFGPAYDAAHETTLTGTIEEVVTKHSAGNPPGMHLLVTGPHGVVDTHLGPYLTEETKDALHTGTPIQVVGATTQVRGKQYFLARELSVGGRTITIRNAHGFLVLPHVDRTAKATTTADAEVNGGAR